MFCHNESLKNFVVRSTGNHIEVMRTLVMAMERIFGGTGTGYSGVNGFVSQNVWKFPQYIDTFTESTFVRVHNFRFQNRGNRIFVTKKVFGFERFKDGINFDLEFFQSFVDTLNFIRNREKYFSMITHKPIKWFSITVFSGLQPTTFFSKYSVCKRIRRGCVFTCWGLTILVHTSVYTVNVHKMYKETFV